jgi:hypothetical protein
MSYCTSRRYNASVKRSTRNDTSLKSNSIFKRDSIQEMTTEGQRGKKSISIR